MHLGKSRLCFFTGIFISFIVIVSAGNAAEITFDDFNDGVAGSNLGGAGTAGGMSPDGTSDPTVEFSTDSQEGSYAIKFTYDVPVAGWNGYWSFTTDDIATPGTYSVSAFTDIRFYAKGASGGENFKVELVTGVGDDRKLQAVYINTISGFTSGLGTDYAEIVIPFTSYSLLNMAELVQVNIVFDQGPVASSVYIDNIRFSDGTTSGNGESVFTIDDFNDGVYGNNLGSGAGAADPVGYPDIQEGGTSNEYVNRSDLEPGTADLVYFVSGDNAYNGSSYGFELTYNAWVNRSSNRSWVGYWTQFVAKEDAEAAKPFDLTAISASAVRFWAKGALGGEKFKVEMKYTGKTEAPYPTQQLTSLQGFTGGLSEEWQQVTMDLSAFSPTLDLATATEFVIVFDQEPYEGTIYIDDIEFVVSTGTIPAPAVIAHTPIQTIGILGNKVVIEATVQDEGSVTEVSLYYRKQTDTTYTRVFSNPGSSTYNFKENITSDFVTTDGIDYYLTATDDAPSTAYYTASGYTPSIPTTINPLQISVSQTTTGIIGASGGTITVTDGNSDDGNSKLTIPAGALNGSTTIVLSQESTSSAPAIGDNTLINSNTPVAIFDFSPAGTQFNTPVTLSMLYFDYNPSNGTVDDTSITETTLRLFNWDGYDWRYVGRTGYDATTNTVTANIISFSKYALFPLKAEPTANDYRPKEKIITPSDSVGKNDFARFNGFTGEIKIYDVTGREIRTITGTDIWNGRDDDGNIVESGVYIYKFKSNGTSVNGMIAVAK